MMPLIFVVDSALDRRNAIQYSLEGAGYPVKTFATTRVLGAAEQLRPAAMLIAIDLPDGKGIDLCRQVRQCAALAGTRTILLANNKTDKYRAVLESGADDCVSAPFAPGELTCCIEGLLHRAGGAGAPSTEARDIVINSAAMKVKVRGNEITITTLEFRLIDYMARHQGKVFSRDALLDAVWGDLQFVTPRSVDACIRRIRRKIEHDSSSPTLLKTIRGIGYKLEAKPVWEMASTDVCQCAICSATRRRVSAAAAEQKVRSTSTARPYSL